MNQDEIEAAVREALACKESGEEKVILTALCGHGHLDLASYEKYLHGDMVDYELPDEADANLFEIENDVLRELGIGQLPTSLAAALETMERSELVQEALGEHIFEWFLRNKRAEWRGYKTHVSAYERDRYLMSL